MNITDRPVAVLAGTPVDTEMGAEVLRRHGLEPLCCPVSRTPPEQAAFQVRPAEEKRAELTGILRSAMAQGCGSAFIYFPCRARRTFRPSPPSLRCALSRP